MTTTLLSDVRADGTTSPAIGPVSSITWGSMASRPDPQKEKAVWGRFWPLLNPIEVRHNRDNDPEAPRLSGAVLNGARLLLRKLEDAGALPPTLMTGTCDATITLEWHDKVGSQTFRSLDVLSENTAEEFVMNADAEPTLRKITF